MKLEERYNGYVYGYPHKTAYRPLAPPISLRELWSTERRDSLFLYLHIPFCEMRCGFCNLFTTANPKEGVEQSYLEALAREAVRVRDALGNASFARVAIGGGTPTFLNRAGLEKLFEMIESDFGVDPHQVPVSVETSPMTAEREKLEFLRERGVRRISIGVQSFFEHEARAAGRSQKRKTVETALDRIRATGFPILNLDLIYGLPEQTVKSWLDSLRAALTFNPEELFLYPLYRRPLTGLDRRETGHGVDIRPECYWRGCDLLLEAGYRQVSMRLFQRPKSGGSAEPIYCCQNDGMVGLGCGARSYTRGLHYSHEYAVGSSTVREILTRYGDASEETFDFASYGVWLDEQEQQRRFLLQSLLQVKGLDLRDYRNRFGGDAVEDFPELRRLAELGLAIQEANVWRLTEEGLGMSDAIGPSFYSSKVRSQMNDYLLR